MYRLKRSKRSLGPREGGESVIFTGAQDSKGSQKSEIYLILGPKRVEFLKILGPLLKFRYESGARSRKKTGANRAVERMMDFTQGPVKFYNMT